MGWLIAGLLGLVLLAGLVVFARRLGSYRRPADDTLVTELLGPSKESALPARPTRAEAEPPPVPLARAEAEPPPVPLARAEAEPPPVPQASADAEPPPVPPARVEAEPPPVPQTQAQEEREPAPPAGAGDWLETQLAWITSWSQQMHHEIKSAGRPGPDRSE